jgi:hypothetical protein
MTLHVQLQGGHGEALAVLERGDFTALGAGWAQLQNRLAEHGIRLAPLALGADHSGGFAGQQFTSARGGQDQSASDELSLPTLSQPQTSGSGLSSVRTTNASEWWA